MVITVLRQSQKAIHCKRFGHQDYRLRQEGFIIFLVFLQEVRAVEYKRANYCQTLVFFNLLELQTLEQKDEEQKKQRRTLLVLLNL